jgi:hypothetical protein
LQFVHLGEMNKLQLFNAPLKVLITYARAGEDMENVLLKYTKIIETADVFGDIARLRRQLVVFGDKIGAFPTWRSFLYETGGFVEPRWATPDLVAQQ